MTDELEGHSRTVVDHVADLVAAYISNNQVFPSELPALIATVHASLAGLSNGSELASAETQPELPTLAQIRRSITPDALISFIDGKPYKMLKRHLGLHGLDAMSYRQKYRLPLDYPMVAPSYSEQRSELAKGRDFGRGSKGRSKKTG